MDWAALFAILLTVAMVAVIITDIRHYIIPNALNIFILGAYPFAAYLLGLDWPMAALAGGIALAIGMGIFAFGFMGGGDIKLLAILVLWIGWDMAAINFIFLTAIAGGALVIAVYLARFLLPPFWRGRNLPRVLSPKQPVPYGIAIAAGFIVVLWSGQIPGIGV